MTAWMTRGVLQADGSVRVEPTTDVQHVATAVRHMASLPLEASVQFLTVVATSVPFIGSSRLLPTRSEEPNRGRRDGSPRS
jgi:hypothetical protein